MCTQILTYKPIEKISFCYIIIIIIIIIYIFNLNCIIIVQNRKALVYYEFYEQKIRFVKMLNKCCSKQNTLHMYGYDYFVRNNYYFQNSLKKFLIISYFKLKIN